MLYFPRWKVILIVAICAIGIVTATPNFLSRVTAENLPGWLPNKQINLGLDLQGGSHLLLEVDVEAVVEERLDSTVDSVRGALRKARIGYVGLDVSNGAVTLRVRKDEDVNRALDILRNLAVQRVPTLISPGGSDIFVEEHGDNRIDIRLTEAEIAEIKNNAIEQSIEIVRRRIDELGTREPTIQREGQDRIIVQLPGIENPERIKELLKATAKLAFRMVDVMTNPAEAERGRIPPGSELLPSADDRGPLNYVVRKRVILSGDMLVDAQPTFSQGQPVVSFRFNSVGAKRFADVTSENVGRPFAVVLDGKVITAPRINEPILGGSGIITGNFTVQTANDLALLLRAGALPAPLKILEERTVGPDLGADSIRAGRIAALIGFFGVVVFIVVSYGAFGLAANAALFINMVLIAGALSTLQATLTLPGIAGIVLTIGMAVDANVLVFERIREEVRSGKTPIAALDAGYSRAYSTILDANITTLIAAVILFQFGSGPVKGFAVTLAIGIVTSVFTAVTVTRLMLATWLRRARPENLPI
ncbi:MAG: protein translocase subunit SecD [Sphingomonadales bacterium]